MQQMFCFGDAAVKFVFLDPGLSSIILPMIEEQRREPSGSAVRFTCIFETSPHLHEPSEASLVHDGPLGAGVADPSQIYVAVGKEWLCVPGAGSVEVDHLKKTATVRSAPGARRLVTASIALYALDAALSATGQQLLHAAGLMLPASDKALLIFAPSGAGKTTASLALALNGFAMLTDDALVLRQQGSEPAIWGLSRPMKVHWRTVELLPRLKGLFGPTWNDEGEQVLTRRNFSGVGSIASTSAASIAGIFLLGERSGGDHAIEPISKADLLVALANDNIGVSRAGVLRRQVRKMEELALAVAKVPAARLHVGQPIDRLGAAIVEYCAAQSHHSARSAVSA